jgi:DNA/RNA non-specific endonuclease
MRDYKTIVYQAPKLDDRQSIIDHLNHVLPDLWLDDYLKMVSTPGEVLTVSFGDGQRIGHFVTYMFDHTSGGSGDAAASVEPTKLQEDRVVAVWGTSRSEPARTRDTGRMKHFLGGVWSSHHENYDRGHFFAHTMGGGLDINLFPQRASVNRRGLWRKMEWFCANNPGTFCFIHPVYSDASWKPTLLEYGIVKMPPEHALDFWGHEFGN